jgi:hypothetical protein
VNARIRSGLPLAVHRCRFDTSDACTRCAVRGCPQADDMPLFSVSWWHGWRLHAKAATGRREAWRDVHNRHSGWPRHRVRHLRRRRPQYLRRLYVGHLR